jgi:predicted RNA-binding protein associated with RNAse of E/G family
MPGVDPDHQTPAWYVDLMHMTDRGGELVARDLYIDVMIPTDGRHQRLLDLDEFADAIEEEG